MKKISHFLLSTMFFASFFSMQAQFMSPEQLVKKNQIENIPPLTSITADVENFQRMPLVNSSETTLDKREKSKIFTEEQKFAKLPANVNAEFRKKVASRQTVISPEQANAMASASETKTYFGGYNLYNDGLSVSVKEYNLFKFDLEVGPPCSLLPSPMNSDFLYSMGQSIYLLYPRALCWVGRELYVQTIFKDMLNAQGSPYLAFALLLDPITGNYKVVGSNNNDAINVTRIAYNGTNIYGVNPYSGELYKCSPTDSLYTLLDTLTHNGTALTGLKAIRSIAFDNEGLLYAVCRDNYLYKINITSGTADAIGDLGINVGTYETSMTFDKNTNILYYQNSGDYEDLGTIDVNTGKYTKKYRLGSETTGLFHWKYTSNPPPNACMEFSANLNPSNSKEYTLRWKNPSLNFDGSNLTGLAKVYIYRGTSSQNVELIDSVKTTSVGEISTYTGTEAKDGKYYYGVQAVTSSGLLGPIVSIPLFVYPMLSLPYTTSFEGTLPSNIVATGAAGLSARVDSLPKTGNSSWKLQGAKTANMELNNVKMVKGAQYSISFWGRLANTAVGNSNNFSYTVNGSSEKILTIQDTIYKLYNAVYTATSTQASVIAFASTNTRGDKYIDDLELKMLYPETTPGVIDSIAYITPSSLGALSYEVSWRNPSVDAEGKPLSKLKGVIVERALSLQSGDPTLRRDTVSTSEIGGIVQATISVPEVGRYYFRFQTLNEDGPSPFVTQLTNKQEYVGKDTVPEAVKGFKFTPNPNGTITISFNKHSGLGKNQGYLDGSITKYRVIRNYFYAFPSALAASDTTYTSDTSFSTVALPLGFYSFAIAAVRNDLNVGLMVEKYSVGGLTSSNRILQNATPEAPEIQAFSFPLSFTSTSNMSAFSQVLFSPSETKGKPCLIDTIYLFVSNNQGAQHQQIYMGYSKDSIFATRSSFQAKENFKLVFDDTLRTNPSLNVLAIKIDPFYYDGKNPLIITFVKPKQIAKVTTEPQPMMLLGGAEFKMLAVANGKGDQNDYGTITPVLGSLGLTRPVTVVNNMKTAAIVTGIVKNSRDRLLSNATVTVKENDKVYTTTSTNSEGEYTLYLPAKTFAITFSSVMMADTTFTFTFTPEENKTLDVIMKDAEKITFKGTIVDPHRKGLKDVDVTITGDTTYRAITNEFGVFEVSDVYGATQYVVSTQLPMYMENSVQVNVKETDFIMDTMMINYVASPPTEVQASVVADDAQIHWQKPLFGNEISWTVDDKMATSMGSNGNRIILAQMFTPDDLENFGVGTGADAKVKQIRFYSGTPTAEWTLKIYEGSNPDIETPVYRQIIGNLSVGTHVINVKNPYAIDPTKELYIALEITAGYSGYPMGIDDGPVKEGQGSRIYSAGAWTDLDKVSKMKANWYLHTFIELPATIFPLGYHLYRGVEGAEASVDTWTKLNTETLTTLTYTDETYSDLPFGQYKYAVKADWMHDNLSEAIFSNKLNKDMEFTVQAQINTNGSPKIGAIVTLRNTDSADSHVYTSTTPTTGLVSIPNVWRGTYEVEVNLKGNEIVKIQNVTIARDTLLTLPELIEIIGNPTIADVQINENTALMSWNLLSDGDWADDFESYPDFAIANIGDYILGDTVKKGYMENYSWTNNLAAQSFIVMNPSRTTPPLPAEFTANSGNKYLGAWFSNTPPNNDWIIRSVPSRANGGILSFFAWGLGDGGIESFRVLSSDKTSAKEDFTTLHSSPTMFAGTEWEAFDFIVPANAKYIAINYVSNNQFCLFVDDLSFSKGASPKSFEIYLDGNKIADTLSTVSQYRFTNLTPGNHIVGIKAIYYSGASSLVTKEITISSVAKPIKPAISMENGNALFTWDIPAGYNPTAYEVYLDGNKLSSITEKSYTFVSPTIGSHTAGVIAVFGTEKSEMVSVEFKSVRIDDIAADAGISVYPNPSSNGYFNLTVNGSYEIIVTQYNGKIISQGKVVAGKNVIDLSAQPRGVYFIKLQNVDGIYTVKIVK